MKNVRVRGDLGGYRVGKDSEAAEWGSLRGLQDKEDYLAAGLEETQGAAGCGLLRGLLQA